MMRARRALTAAAGAAACSSSGVLLWHFTSSRPPPVSAAAAAAPAPAVYTAEEVARRNGRGGRRAWFSLGGAVYDLTDYCRAHPGGSRILEAAGGPVEPSARLPFDGTPPCTFYQVHFNRDKTGGCR